MISRADKIKELEQELEYYDKKDKKRLVVMGDMARIKKLKKQIKTKKYAGLKQTGKNLKEIGGNVGKTFKAIGKGLNDVLGDADKDQGEKKNGIKSFEDTIRDLPQ